MHALRDDAEEVLSRFGMFVFDEVHLLRDGARGLTLESVLAFLHWRTRETPHRIILLSAAMGNAGQLAAWLDVDGSPILQQSEWRGPRRLTALFNTDISDWSNPQIETVRARVYCRLHGASLVPNIWPHPDQARGTANFVGTHHSLARDNCHSLEAGDGRELREGFVQRRLSFDTDVPDDCLVSAIRRSGRPGSGRPFNSPGREAHG